MERILTSAIGVPNSWTQASYVARGGYTSLERALKMEPTAIIDEVKKANLRGRGGAGFPCGVKWGFLPKTSNVPKYLVINADEGEPGTFKDHLLMELDPHRLIEGCIISGWAMGMRACYVFIRGEMLQEGYRVQGAIDEAYAAGMLGENIRGTGWTYDIYVHHGAGAYICGEETALIEALEGKAGQPRLKPPFPAVVGVFSCPTIVNNVETIACIPTIIERGGDWWFQQGHWYQKGQAMLAEHGAATLEEVEDEALKAKIKGYLEHRGGGGPKMVGLSGHVKNPGVFEVPHGFSLQELIHSPEYGGGPRLGADGKPKKIKAVIPGGASCPVLLPAQLDVGLDFESMVVPEDKGGPGTMLGTACALVMDEDTCMVRVAANLAHFYHHESCGQCTPCREGSGWTARVLDAIENGVAEMKDVELLLDICDNVEGNTICPFGDALAMAVRSYVTKFREEFIRHVEEGGCPYPHW